MLKKIVFTILNFLFFTFSYSQNIVTIEGVIKGLGSGKKILIGNKPNGISPSFVYTKFDSTTSYNDSFRFCNLSFKTPIYYSLEFEGCVGWKSFFVDTGKITVTGNSDSVYNSKVRGSRNNEVIREYYNGLYNDWYNAHQMILTRLNLEKDSNANKKILDTVIMSISYFKNKTIKFYDSKVNQFPYAAFYLLRNITLNNYSDSFVSAKFNLLSGEVQKSPPLEDIYYRLKLAKGNVKVGKKIPNFIFKTENNSKTDLFSLSSKYKLLVFGASWCVPCLNEIKYLDSLHNLFQKEGLSILAVNVDNTEDKWKIYASNFKTPCLQLFAGSPSTSKIYKYFNINSIPFMVLLDSKNQIIKNDIKLEEIKKYMK